jgi:hypothetical protein
VLIQKAELAAYQLPAGPARGAIELSQPIVIHHVFFVQIKFLYAWIVDGRIMH